MSKLTEKTVAKILQNSCKTENPSHYHKVFDRVLREGHPLSDNAQRRLILWGNHRHIDKVLDQPKLSQSTVWLAHSELNHVPDLNIRLYLRNKIAENFPDARDDHPDTHIHTNANPRPIIKEEDEHLTFGKTLGTHADVRTNFPEADFWVVRKGTEKKVGSVTDEYSPEHIGVRVRNHQMDSKYMKYALMHVHAQGYYGDKHIGTTNLRSIRAQHVKDIPIHK